MFINDEEKARIKNETGQDVRGYCDRCGKPYSPTQKIVFWNYWMTGPKTFCSETCFAVFENHRNGG